MGDQPPNEYYPQYHGNTWHQRKVESAEEEGTSMELNSAMSQDQSYETTNYAAMPSGSGYMYQQIQNTSHPESYGDQRYVTSSSSLTPSWSTSGSGSAMYAGPGNFQYGNTSQSQLSTPRTYPTSSYTTRHWSQPNTDYPTATETPQPQAVHYPQHQPVPSSNPQPEGMYPSPGQVGTPTTLQPPSNTSDYEVCCPYGCGTVLRGVHAVGNLTRHMKSRKCPNSPREKRDFPCPHGCDKSYARSDGLKVHLRKHHGAPPASPRYEHEEGA